MSVDGELVQLTDDAADDLDPDGLRLEGRVRFQSIAPSCIIFSL